LSLSRGLKKKPTGRATQYSKRGIPGMLLKLEEMLGAMFEKWRRVLHRKQSRVTPK
jgi:hypothetical protein